MNIKLTYNDDKKDKCYSHVVGFAELDNDKLYDLTSSAIFGQGASYDEAYEEFYNRFSEFVDTLVEFKKALVNGEKPILVDSMGNPL